MNKSEKKWTIAIVNYKTSIYIKWQLKSFYDFNNPEDFTLVIVDNSRNAEEKEALLNLIEPYNQKYNNITLVFYTPKELMASGQHGEGLTLILKEHTHTPYILFQDPDFFWVKKNVLNWLEEFLINGKVAIGAPYPHKIGGGHPNFPCAYGCAHKVADIKHLDLTADLSEEAKEKSLSLYPLSKGYGFSFDVGWKLRVALSDENNKKNFISLNDSDAIEVSENFGRHSYQTISCKFTYKNKLIAYHLFRGSFTGAVTENHEDPNHVTPDDWIAARDRSGAYFYEVLCHDGNPPVKLRKSIKKAIVHAVLKNSYFRSVVRITLNLLKRNKYGYRFVEYLKTLPMGKAIREVDNLL